jgi:hypothetical protein
MISSKGKKVTGANQVGGLVGWVSSEATVTGHATGEVVGTTSPVGGLVGKADDATITGYAQGVVKRTGGARLTFGKLIGQKDATPNTHKEFYSKDKSKVVDKDDKPLANTITTGVDGKGLTTAEITSTTVFKDFDFTNVWKWNGVGKWPTLK